MIREKQPVTEIVIDLTGPEGNAYMLLAYARGWSKELGLDWSEVQEELTSGDYENLVLTMDKYFGHFVIFER